MFTFLRLLHNRRPILTTVFAFVVVVALATAMSIWWNYLLIENHRILTGMTAAALAAERDKPMLPVALFMVLGMASTLVMVLGLVYLLVRLIRAVQLNVAQSQFIASVTHELRSPVAALQLMLETIRDPSTPPDKREEFESCMQVDLVRLRGLVDQVLETARLENFSAAVAPREPIVLGDVVDGCLAALQPRLKTVPAKLTVEAPASRIIVRANAHLLSTVVGNVLDNALKYSDGTAEITLRVSDAGKIALIEIEDKGIGINRKEQKRIFRRFYRASDPSSRGKPGTGLGLYFARLAIRAQGGNISVKSAGRGLGSTFRIEVPKA